MLLLVFYLFKKIEELKLDNQDTRRLLREYIQFAREAIVRVEERDKYRNGWQGGTHRNNNKKR